MLAIAGGKGGVGRTTTTLGLAASLAGQRRRPVVVDADCGMPTLHALAGVAREPGLARVGRGEPAVDAATRSDRFPAVDVLAGSPIADVRRALSMLPRDRPVVVDCPSGSGRAATLPVRLADRVLVVAGPGRAAISGAAKSAYIARAVGTPVVGVALVGADRPPAGVATAVDAPVLAAVPAASGRPLSDPAVLAAYDRLAAAVTDRTGPADPSIETAETTETRQTGGVRGGNP